MIVHLAHLPEGVATLSWNAGTRRVGLHLDVYGGVGGGTVDVSVRAGHCLDAQPGAPLAEFPAAAADASGDVRADLVSTRAVRGGVPRAGIIDLEDPGGAMLACTDIPAVGSTAPQRLDAPPRFKPGATATLAPRNGGGSDLHLVAVDLAGGGTYTVEVRGGTCPAPQALLATAGQLTATTGGAADWHARLPLASRPGATGWSIWLLDAGGAGGRPAGQPVLCGTTAS